ncbi:AGAP007821-PA-like protein [Anopheles sinensis]|uniref:AGAP007821-PA-like protein n=1 Tax=Anopheles sinensis TaxID=74873 RepID=A0A084VAE3_ANOSI|nr:AGAP007821-PA-like protein [Anopheles sinensis]
MHKCTVGRLLICLLIALVAGAHGASSYVYDSEERYPVPSGNLLEVSVKPELINLHELLPLPVRKKTTAPKQINPKPPVMVVRAQFASRLAALRCHHMVAYVMEGTNQASGVWYGATGRGWGDT